jgi:spore maturation protein CgeB
MKIVVLGLSITSSWGNGHATTYRGLLRRLAERGHEILFLERDAPWYAQNRDLPSPPYCRTELYGSLEELDEIHGREVREADCVIVGSYVPEGIAVGKWTLRKASGITAFYDIDTPVTLAAIDRNECRYLTRELIRRYRLYLSFTGGPVLERLEAEFGSPAARPLYCSVDPSLYFPEEDEKRWDLGYLGTYSCDRQPPLQRLLCEPATAWSSGRFVVAGAQYPEELEWPGNVDRIEHLPPAKHRSFYNSQRFTLNVTRADMIKAGYSPSVRLFEAAACGVPIISDSWEGLDTFFTLGSEILVSDSRETTLRYLHQLPENERAEVGERGREKVLSRHTAAHRAAELEGYINEAISGGGR